MFGRETVNLCVLSQKKLVARFWCKRRCTTNSFTFVVWYTSVMIYVLLVVSLPSHVVLVELWKPKVFSPLLCSGVVFRRKLSLLCTHISFQYWVFCAPCFQCGFACCLSVVNCYSCCTILPIVWSSVSSTLAKFTVEKLGKESKAATRKWK